MIRAKIIGAGGFGGVGATELLLGHPEAEIAALVDVENVGAPIASLYPHLAGATDLAISGPADPRAREPVDVVFMATPDGVGMKLAAAELAAGARVIDYSGDFRFDSAAAYAEYARRLGRDQNHGAAELLPEAVYGLAELNRGALTPETRLVGNPGCFAVSCLLGLAPAVKERVIDPAGIICDCKTGVSGAGKKPNPTFHFPLRYEQMNAYRLAGHQHVCEIETQLGLLAGAPPAVTFTAQVVPVCRGILSTLYGTLTADWDEPRLLELYRSFYRASPFVSVFESTAAVGTMHVRGTNRAFLVVSVDRRARRLRVVSLIDNLIKGQAGSAVQNMNLIFGLPETLGLTRVSAYP